MLKSESKRLRDGLQRIHKRILRVVRRDRNEKLELDSYEVDHINLQLHQVVREQIAATQELVRLQSEVFQLRKAIEDRDEKGS